MAKRICAAAAALSRAVKSDVESGHGAPSLLRRARADERAREGRRLSGALVEELRREWGGLRGGAQVERYSVGL
jgi:hypothetical protein